MKHKHTKHKTLHFRRMKRRVHHVAHRAISHTMQKVEAGKAKELPIKTYSLKVSSGRLPFAFTNVNFDKVSKSEKLLQEFVRFIEKKFDVIWYIGTDYFGDEIFERFMFHNGGFMEISIDGKIRCFFAQDKIKRMKKAIYYANQRMGSEHLAKIIDREIKTGQKLISLKASVMAGEEK